MRRDPKDHIHPAPGLLPVAVRVYAPTCYCFYPPNIPSKFFASAHLTAPPGKIFVSAAPKGIFAPFAEPNRHGVPASPLLITPVRQKKYDLYKGAVDGLWTQAARLFETAQKLMIVGYSFPPTDTRALELLANALKARPGQISVEVVSPDAAQIVRRIGPACLSKAKTVVSYKSRFEDFLSVLARDIPARMRTAAAQHKDVRDWVRRLLVMNQLSQGQEFLKRVRRAKRTHRDSLANMAGISDD